MIKNVSKANSKDHQKNDHQQILKSIPKGCQNVAKTDAETHQESMQKLVSKKIMKIIKSHVFLTGKIIHIHYKRLFFKGLAGCVRER